MSSRVRDTEAVFEQLEALGWVSKMPGPRLNDPRWFINPAVHSKFAARAKEEAMRRQRERRLILDIINRGRSA